MRLKILRKLIENNEAELFFTGVAVNLLNLRPEICTLLLIKSPEWYKLQSQDMATKIEKLKKISYNKEFVRFTEVKDKNDFIYKVEYIEDENELLNSYSFYPNKMVPPGAAAFWLGYDLIKEILI
ncbi:conserved hypothetical protein [Candidatus Methanoperedens nitroreducens]|uniref:Uncharacterized protein n=2 Tax=Candidatus Methanoperedens nitratireducens TaxID=1392998 RepID=A0A284VKL9_9EURY|nr:conserved hypothetical protein [Candidatus Methanoperedens nitroreducens]